ncbi:MAG: rRNA maturation RNase YbeY [Pseudomonadota bacterium]
MNGLAVQLDYSVNTTDTPSEALFQQWTNTLNECVACCGNICVRIVSSEEMSQLNAKFRDKQGLTNVLSFEADTRNIPPQVLLENEELRDLLGDIAICADVVASESIAQNKLKEAHWAHLFVHGVLHLCGYDHIDDSDATVMENLETQILLAMGYAAPYCDINEITTRVS